MKPLGRFNEESRDAESPAAHYLTSVCLDSESSIARASFGPPSAFFHIRKSVVFLPMCVSIWAICG
jgi:hypothetical protein